MTEETQEGPVISEYKGRPVLTLNPGTRFTFTFGLAKAKLIMQHLEAIEGFIKEYEPKKGPP
jgi:hypothetical protein